MLTFFFSPTDFSSPDKRIYFSYRQIYCQVQISIVYVKGSKNAFMFLSLSSYNFILLLGWDLKIFSKYQYFSCILYKFSGGQLLPFYKLINFMHQGFEEHWNNIFRKCPGILVNFFGIWRKLFHLENSNSIWRKNEQNSCLKGLDINKINKALVNLNKIFAIKARLRATDYEQFSRVGCGKDQLNLFCQVAK